MVTPACNPSTEDRHRQIPGSHWSTSLVNKFPHSEKDPVPPYFRREVMKAPEDSDLWPKHKYTCLDVHTQTHRHIYTHTPMQKCTDTIHTRMHKKLKCKVAHTWNPCIRRPRIHGSSASASQLPHCSDENLACTSDFHTKKER